MQGIIDYFVTKFQAFLPTLISAALVVIVGYIIYKVVTYSILRVGRRHGVDEIILNFIHMFLRILASCIVFLIAIGSMGVDLTSVVATFTVVSAAIALAVKDSIASMIDGVKIMFAKPFNKGDLIEVSGTKGTIEEISLFYTFLMTKDSGLPSYSILKTAPINGCSCSLTF